MTTVRTMILALLAGVVAAPVAVAQNAQPQAPATSTLKLHFTNGAFDGGSRSIALVGSKVRIRGTVSKHVAGERYVVRVFRGSKKIRAIGVETSELPGGGGRFFVEIAVKRRGRLTVGAAHEATPALAAVQARPRQLDVAKSMLTPGSGGPVARLVQRQLRKLGYAVPRTGRYDDGTQRAVLAYRKVNSMARTTSINRTIVSRLLRGRGAFRPKFKGVKGRRVEADLSRQVLALIEDGKVVRTYHTSSGTSATPTVRGRYRFYLKTPGTNAKGMVHSSYFIRGYAIHGYASVPTSPASHGCLRVPIPDARSIFDWIRVGDRIDVYP